MSRLTATDDINIAKLYQLNTKVLCKDGSVLYTSYSIFYGIDYFDRMVRSGMIESQGNPELKFDFLSKKDAIVYMNLIANRDLRSIVEKHEANIVIRDGINNIMRYTSQNDNVTGMLKLLYRKSDRLVNEGRALLESLMDCDLINLYKQADYHVIEFIVGYIKRKIVSDSVFSIELYELNLIANILSSKDIAAKFVTYPHGTIPLFRAPDMSDEGFWKEAISIVSNYSYVDAWTNCFSYLDKEHLDLYIGNYCPSMRMDPMEDIREFVSTIMSSIDKIELKQKFLEYITSCLSRDKRQRTT
jgi:hypothetical protein